jgi:hypothetical protein
MKLIGILGLIVFFSLSALAENYDIFVLDRNIGYWADGTEKDAAFKRLEQLCTTAYGGKIIKNSVRSDRPSAVKFYLLGTCDGEKKAIPELNNVFVSNNSAGYYAGIDEKKDALERLQQLCASDYNGELIETSTRSHKPRGGEYYLTGTCIAR